jgi:hypothetical protein
MIFTEPKEHSTHIVSLPNDGAYKAICLEKTAKNLRDVIEFHCGYSHGGYVTENHPLVLAMKTLAEEHRKCVASDNRGHDPKIFELNDDYFLTSEEFWKKYCIKRPNPTEQIGLLS